MSTIYFSPEEIKGLAESLIAKGHDREAIYDLMQVAHAANAVAYETRYAHHGDAETEVFDLRDESIVPDANAFLVRNGIGSLLYNLDAAAPEWLVDRLFGLREYQRPQRLYGELGASKIVDYAKWTREAIENNQPEVAYWYARHAATCAFVEKPQLRPGQENVLTFAQIMAGQRPANLPAKPKRRARKATRA